MSQKYNIKKEENKHKEILYNIYTQLQSIIKNDKNTLPQFTPSVSMSTVINYVKESIDIIIKLYNSMLTKSNKKINNNNIVFNTYTEQQKVLDENRIKYLISKNFFYKFQIELLENKLASYNDLEQQYIEMKEAIKYDNGHILNNDRKDNEIIIIRKENSILKTKIEHLENEIKVLNDIKTNQNRSISILNKKVQELSMKVAKLKSFNNISVVTNIHPSINKERANSVHCSSSTHINKKLFNYIRKDKYHKTMFSSSSSKNINNTHRGLNKSLNFYNETCNTRKNILLFQNFSTTNQSSYISNKDTSDNKKRKNLFKKINFNRLDYNSINNNINSSYNSINSKKKSGNKKNKKAIIKK